MRLAVSSASRRAVQTVELLKRYSWGVLATARVSSGEVGVVQRFAVEPHLAGYSVEVLPEGERKIDVVAEIDHAVEGEF
ncbi:hypothetical protein ABZV61_41670 [Streptomyces sp900116325]|uniref:Uncharacterized protein n=1 Tax=Streptomyces sp. 900116325 TaxID=3154295 RepID=A0ABV2UQM7_9ACTN